MEEVKITVPSGLGNATPQYVANGVTFSSDSGVKQTGTFNPSADEITYNNTNSGLQAENVQAAIDELKTTKAESSHNHEIDDVNGLSSALEGKSSTTHTHDERYYTESEIDNKLNEKAPSTHSHSADDITSGTLPVTRGGTGATAPAIARSNLGFTYGTEEPSSAPSTGAGSVYFMEDDGTPTPISEGGTGATTVEGILANLGIADYIVEQGTTDAWSWEKYANGKIHCTRMVTTGYTATSQSGNLYYKDYDIVVPDAVPVLTGTINNVIIMPQMGNGLSFFMPMRINGKTIGYRYINSASVSNNQLTVLYQFDGKWK